MDSERFSVELIKLREEMSKSRHSNNDHIVSVINEIINKDGSPTY
jgi:hypothetical protein